MLALAIAAITVVAMFGVWALVSTRSAGIQKARADVADEKNKELTDKLAERSAALITEKERGDALDAAVAKFAAQAVGPVLGAYAELLQAVADARRRAGGSPVVPDAGPPISPATPIRASDDDLLEPGQ